MPEDTPPPLPPADATLTLSNDIILTGGECKVMLPANKVKVEDAVQFHQDGRVIGSLDAVYDFDQIPPELHQSAIQMVYRKQVLCLPLSDEVAPVVPEDKGDDRPWWKRWLGL